MTGQHGTGSAADDRRSWRDKMAIRTDPVRELYGPFTWEALSRAVDNLHRVATEIGALKDRSQTGLSDARWPELFDKTVLNDHQSGRAAQRDLEDCRWHARFIARENLGLSEYLLEQIYKRDGTNPSIGAHVYFVADLPFEWSSYPQDHHCKDLLRCCLGEEGHDNKAISVYKLRTTLRRIGHFSVDTWLDATIGALIAGGFANYNRGMHELILTPFGRIDAVAIESQHRMKELQG